MISLNILDYVLIDEGGNAQEALTNTAELAKLADKLGYRRFWVPEQHYALSIASSSPEMIMMHLADVTTNIRIGSGGVMLPHYSPYKVAENIRTLEAVHPGRIDLGIGNSSGGRLINRVLNEEKTDRLTYEQLVQDTVKYLTDDTISPHRFKRVKAAPMVETTPEVWMLGAGGRGKEIASDNGTAYMYAHFVKPFQEGAAVIENYKENFQPSPFYQEPKAGFAAFTIIGETEEEAKELAKAFEAWMIAIETAKNPAEFPSVETSENLSFSNFEEQKRKGIRKRAIVGDPKQVKEELLYLAEYYQADEITIIPNFPGAGNRQKGIQLLAEAFDLESPKSK